jgi:hypothetical protein
MDPLSAVMTRLVCGHSGGDRYQVASLRIADESALPFGAGALYMPDNDQECPESCDT